jgi:hypothetical protein
LGYMTPEEFEATQQVAAKSNIKSRVRN